MMNIPLDMVHIYNVYHSCVPQLLYSFICQWTPRFWFSFLSLFICFIFGCAESLFLLCRLSLVDSSRGYSSLWCGGFFCSRAQALSMQTSGVATHGLNSYAAEAQLPLRVWSLPRPGTESMSPALIDRFLTTRPPGKPCFGVIFKQTAVEHGLNIQNNLTLLPVPKHKHGSGYSLLKTTIINKLILL